MTDDHDFDRLARAWLELSPDRAPERSVAAVLQAVEVTPQVRRWSRWLPGRDIQMTRLSLLTSAAVVGLIAVSGLLILNRPNPAITAVPSPSPRPTPSPLGEPLPSELVGGWVAPSRGTSLEQPDITTFVLGGSGVDRWATEFAMSVPHTATWRLGSNVVETEPGVLRFILSRPGASDCGDRDTGDYRWSLSADGQWLTLDLIADACADRSAVLAGTWQRNMGFRSSGGPGVVTAFTPYMTIDLPSGTFTGSEYAMLDTLSIDGDDVGLKVWKDLEGFADPCDRAKGRLALAPGMAGFLAYLNEDPRFTVISQEDMTIGGQPAVKVEFKIGDGMTAPCWTFDGNPDDRSGVLTWIPKGETDAEFFWNAPLGSSDTLFVTEVNGATLVFEGYAVREGKEVIDQSLIDSVRFLDALPSAP
jgi:hypothetical protein